MGKCNPPCSRQTCDTGFNYNTWSLYLCLCMHHGKVSPAMSAHAAIWQTVCVTAKISSGWKKSWGPRWLWVSRFGIFHWHISYSFSCPGRLCGLYMFRIAAGVTEEVPLWWQTLPDEEPSFPLVVHEGEAGSVSLCVTMRAPAWRLHLSKWVWDQNIIHSQDDSVLLTLYTSLSVVSTFCCRVCVDMHS